MLLHTIMHYICNDYNNQIMKKFLIAATCFTVIVSSCGTYSGGTASVGASLGSILGSAIGGIAGGPRGSDIGTVIGMAGGAVVGAAVGQKAEQQESQDMHDRYERIRQRKAELQGYQKPYDDTAYDGDGYGKKDGDAEIDPNNGGDDRLYDFNGPDYTGTYSASRPTVTTPMTSSVDQLAAAYKYSEAIEIVNARFVDDNKDNALNRNELCKVIFEVRNRSAEVLHDIVPTVVEASGNQNIFISPSIHVESLAPGQVIRYTAMVKSSNRLKNGTARFCLSVLQGGKTISKVTEFNITTTKRKLK